MARAIPFDGYNRNFEQPLEVGDIIPAMETMPGYCNSILTFTRWKLSAEEYDEVMRTGEVWMAARTGGRPMQPHWLGSLPFIKWVCADLGGMWKSSPPKSLPDDSDDSDDSEAA